ncbi:MAG TPA: hypothetical protein VHJ69_00880 [Gemmatimonadales bacterium]|jgi:hypothetical protein|nr:hypothetical protein [Gemmatimonadales bacterium]
MPLVELVRRAARAAIPLFIAGCSSTSGVETGPRPDRGAAATPGGDPETTAPAAAGAILYRPAPATTFALQRRDSLTLQLPGGATQVQEYRRTAYLGIAVRGAAPPYEVTIQLDSLRQEGGSVPPDSLFRAEGTRWAGALSASGELTDLRADRMSTIGDQIGATLHLLFPSLPLGGLEQGSQWTDTTRRSLRADAFDATETAVTSYRATNADGRAITIESRTTFERTGTGGQAAQPMEMSAGGARRGVYRFGRNGGVLTAEGADSAEMTISVPAVGQTVPVSQRATWSIESLAK